MPTTTPTTRSGARCALVLTLALAVAGSAGCAATRARRSAAPPSGFLGDYSDLRRAKGYDAQRVFVAPDAKWSSYHAIHLDSVTLWATGQSERKLSDADRQLLTDIVYKALHDKLGERFVMADRSGPQTIELRAALTEAHGANVPLNVITTVVPQLRVLTTVGGLATDTAALVGSASVEIEARDSVTKRRLGAAMDSRAGNKSLLRAFSKWADVQAAADRWAERVRDFFVREGVRQRS
jgi:hypothetical protein